MTIQSFSYCLLTISDRVYDDILSSKTKHRNGLNTAPDMITHLSSIKPHITKLRWEETKA